jgi:hypothetical protein
MQIINHALIDDAFLHLSAPLPEIFGEYEKGYLQGLKDFRRHVKTVLSEGVSGHIQ